MLDHRDIVSIDAGRSDNDFQFYSINPRFMIFLAKPILQVNGCHLRIEMFVKDVAAKTMSAIDFTHVSHLIRNEKELFVVEVIQNPKLF
jgi:hypothetical protein